SRPLSLLDCRRLACRVGDVLTIQGLCLCWIAGVSPAELGGRTHYSRPLSLLDCRRLACRVGDVLTIQGLRPCWMRDASNPARIQSSTHPIQHTAQIQSSTQHRSNPAQIQSSTQHASNNDIQA
ncbi:MAG: hypothetical protein LHW51_08110, partial [Candidatus Cloacimonetes bacterium]|nr:hypothetical protein [Candidatus Cloacimonadota bacterium]